MNLLENLSTVARHATNDTSLANGWDGATLEITFERDAVGYQGVYRTAEGTSKRFSPASQLLGAAVQRLRRQLPPSTRKVLVCMRPDHEPWAMVHTARDLRIVPDELPSLRMSPSEA